MVVNFTKLGKVKFPVFKLESGNWSLQDGLLMLDGEIVDDKNMPGKSLGIRRLQTTMPLARVRKSINSAIGIIKEPSETNYIDSDGKPFVYHKTKYAKVKSLKIRKLIPKDGLGTQLVLVGIRETFYLPRPPKQDANWASIIYIGNFPWLVYGFSTEEQKPRRLKI